MSATQISYIAFALAAFADNTRSIDVPGGVDTQQVVSVVLCAPPVTQAASVLVAQPVAADGGECAPFTGNFEPYRRVRWEDFRRDFYEWDDTLTGGGMDASAYIPHGAHRGFVGVRLGGDLGVLADGYSWSYVR